MRPAIAACALLSIGLVPDATRSSIASEAASAAPAPSSSASGPAMSNASAAAPAVASAPTTSSASFTVVPLVARTVEKGICGSIAPGGEFPGNYLSQRDITTSYVDGDDLLALVNRSPLGTVAADYAPSDLVQAFTMKPATGAECETRVGPCLRQEAALALKDLLAAMREKGIIGRVESAYRGYQGQCGTFVNWAKKATSEFCSAVDQSALAGHSQHQLGTTIDIFTEDWAKEGKDKNESSFRSGFGCTYAGKWIDEHSWESGWVVPYPIHVDDRQKTERCLQRWDMAMPANPRTGYKNEPWHLRYIGKGNARAYHDAWLASGPDTPNEITLEQWLRARLGRTGDADLPVCDGCACEACATLAGGDGKAKPCGDANPLWLDAATGKPVTSATPPKILDVKITPKPDREGAPRALLVEVRVQVPARTVTQPPVMRAEGAAYVGGATFESLVPYKKRDPHRYADLPGAWRVGVDIDPAPASPEPVPAWRWRASLAKEWLGRTYNRANLYLPAATGETWIRFVVEPPGDAHTMRIALVRDGEAHGARELAIPGAQGVAGAKRSE